MSPANRRNALFVSVITSTTPPRSSPSAAEMSLLGDVSESPEKPAMTATAVAVAPNINTIRARTLKKLARRCPAHAVLLSQPVMAVLCYPLRGTALGGGGRGGGGVIVSGFTPSPKRTVDMDSTRSASHHR